MHMRSLSRALSRTRLALPATMLAATLGLAACGGGGNPTPPAMATPASVNAVSAAPQSAPSGGFKQFVVFGDSLSDDGAYTLAAITVYSLSLYNIPFTGLPYAGGGEFTVNGGTGNWTDVLAKSLGISLTPNSSGYGTIAGDLYLTPSGVTTSASAATCAFSAPPASGQASCTDFAQGGSMVSNAIGIGHTAGALTYPLTTQLQNYLTQFGGFNPNQLVAFLGGNNDILTALQTVQSSVTAAVQQAVQQALAANPNLTAAQQQAGGTASPASSRRQWPRAQATSRSTPCPTRR